MDLDDFGRLQACLKGTAMPYEPGCEKADLDGDDDVDQLDVAKFLGCLSGANIPVEPSWAN